MFLVELSAGIQFYDFLFVWKFCYPQKPGIVDMQSY